MINAEPWTFYLREFSVNVPKLKGYRLKGIGSGLFTFQTVTVAKALPLAGCIAAIFDFLFLLEDLLFLQRKQLVFRFEPLRVAKNTLENELC